MLLELAKANADDALIFAEVLHAPYLVFRVEDSAGISWVLRPPCNSLYQGPYQGLRVTINCYRVGAAPKS